MVNNMPRLVWMDIDSTINTVALIQIDKGFIHATYIVAYDVNPKIYNIVSAVYIVYLLWYLEMEMEKR